jgi:HK97 family phage major capsid protein
MSMNIDALLAQVRANLATKLAQRQTHTDAIDAVRGACMADAGREPTDAEAAQVRSAQEARSAIDTEAEALQGRITELQDEKRRDDAAAALSREVTPTSSRAAYDEVVNRGDVNEARTYTPQTSARGTSWFCDAWKYERRSGDNTVTQRLERHAREVEVHSEMTDRAVSTGSFAGLVVPQYLVDLAAPTLRAGRPFANSIGPSLPLPDSGMTFQIPRGTTGASVAVQATENTSVSTTDEAWANLTLNVSTIAGQADVSRQSLERGAPGTDALLYMDLAGAYGVGLDQQVLAGSGSANQVLGVFNTAGVSQESAFTAAVTPQSFYSKVAGGINDVETKRFLPPTAIAMHPRRWNWMLTQFDNAGRPLVVPNPQGPMNAMATEDALHGMASATPVGSFQGLPVITDASMPTAVGVGAEDQVVIYRREDLLLWEDGDGMPRELRFEQTLGNQLTVKLVSYGYIAFTAGRYPQSVAIVGGNSGAGFGLQPPVF